MFDLGYLGTEFFLLILGRVIRTNVKKSRDIGCNLESLDGLARGKIELSPLPLCGANDVL